MLSESEKKRLYQGRDTFLSGWVTAVLARALALGSCGRAEKPAGRKATSHLDAGTERAITEALQREAPGRTLVVVAHRLSTIRRADHIIVLERGRVVEQGTHEALLALEGGHYRALVENQLEAS